MILYTSLYWKGEIHSKLWPMAVVYATYIYKCIPNEIFFTVDLFTWTTVPRYKLHDIHVFRTLVYVLDSKIQQMKKLPKCEPRSKRGIFMVLNPNHANYVLLVINIITRNISTQYHAVFDDEFSTAPSVGKDELVSPFWNELDLENHTNIIPLDVAVRDMDHILDEDWLNFPEIEE